MLLAFGIPAPFLVSLRMASFKYERPLWDLLLLHEDKWWLSLPVVVTAFTALAFAFVSVVLLNFYHEGDLDSEAKVKAAARYGSKKGKRTDGKEA